MFHSTYPLEEGWRRAVRNLFCGVLSDFLSLEMCMDYLDIILCLHLIAGDADSPGT